MLQEALDFTWHSKAFHYMGQVCALEAELSICRERELAQRVYADRMRRGLVEIANLPGGGTAMILARRALGMEE